MAQQMERRLRHGSLRMQYIMDRYRAAHPDEGPDIRPDLVADWAVENGIWRPLPISPKETLRRLIARCLRETYLIDPQGREVRAHLPMIEQIATAEGPKQISRYFPIFETPPRVARTSFALRRRAALHDVLQLHFDWLSYNENNVFGEGLESLDFNFNEDIQELEQPTVYPGDRQDFISERDLEDSEEPEGDEEG